MPMTRAHVYVHGRVQGVFFRASARDNARLFDIKGWVKNCFDGSVEAVFEGKKDAVDNMVNWCRKGPSKQFFTHPLMSNNLALSLAEARKNTPCTLPCT